MADVYPPSNNPYNKQNMRRTAPSGASSRIPLSSDIDKVERFPSAPQPSRLQQLQANFQHKVMKEKEAKMIDLYEQKQCQALQRITKHDRQKGMVRDFFRERRMIEQGAIQSQIPTRDEHFNRMKSEMQQQRDAINKRQDLSKMYSKEDLNRRPPEGLDRAKPLAPLKHRSTIHNMNISEHKFTEKRTNEHSKPSQVILSKKKLKKTESLHKLPKRYSQQNLEESSSSDEDPRSFQPQIKEPKTLQRWEQNNIEKKTVFVGNKKKVVSEINEDRPDFANKASYKSRDVAPKRKEEKMSDFQKWQMEQNLEREHRLNKLRKQRVDENVNDFNEQFEDNEWKRNEPIRKEVKKKKKNDERQKQIDIIKQKEKELQEIIAKQEAELRMIKESYVSDDCGTPRDLNDSMNRMKLQNKKTLTKKLIKKQENIQDPIPPKAKKPARIRQQSIKDNNTKMYQQKLDQYEENQTSFARNNDYGYDLSGALEESDQVMPLDLKTCSECGRKFAADRLAKHSVICRKALKKKRKTYDMTKHRTAGTEMAQYVKNGRHLKSEPTPKKSNWKRKHEDFVRTIRDARIMQAHIAKGGKASDLPPPPPSDNSDYKQCPYCKRRFNPSTAERHIPKCKDIKSRPKPPSKRR